MSKRKGANSFPISPFHGGVDTSLRLLNIDITALKDEFKEKSKALFHIISFCTQANPSHTSSSSTKKTKKRKTDENREMKNFMIAAQIINARSERANLIQAVR